MLHRLYHFAVRFVPILLTNLIEAFKFLATIGFLFAFGAIGLAILYLIAVYLSRGNETVSAIIFALALVIVVVIGACVSEAISTYQNKYKSKED